MTNLYRPLEDLIPVTEFTATDGQTLFTVPWLLTTYSTVRVLVNSIEIPTSSYEVILSTTNPGADIIFLTGLNANDKVYIERYTPLEKSSSYQPNKIPDNNELTKDVLTSMMATQEVKALYEKKSTTPSPVYLDPEKNLSDLESTSTARTNLNVYDKDIVYTKSETDVRIGNVGALIPQLDAKIDNVSIDVNAKLAAQDVKIQTSQTTANTASAKADAAVVTASDAKNIANAASAATVGVMRGSSNLSDLADKSAARAVLQISTTQETQTAMEAYVDREIVVRLPLINDGIIDPSKTWSSEKIDNSFKQFGGGVSDFLRKDDNLASVLDKAEARTNLDVYDKAEVQALVTGDIATAGLLLASKNLSDLSDKAVARTNLSVYSKAEVDTKVQTDLLPYMKGSNNLSDLSDKAVARTNLNVYDKTTVDSVASRVTAVETTSTSNTSRIATLEPLVSSHTTAISGLQTGQATADTDITKLKGDVTTINTTLDTKADKTSVYMKDASGNINLGDHGITGLTDPINGKDAAPKRYVDAMASAVVLGKLNTPPTSPAVGDMYIVDTAPTGVWVGTANSLIIWNGTNWFATYRSEGTVVLNKSDGKNYVKSSTSWALQVSSVFLPTVTTADNNAKMVVTSGSWAKSGISGAQVTDLKDFTQFKDGMTFWFNNGTVLNPIVGGGTGVYVGMCMSGSAFSGGVDNVAFVYMSMSRPQLIYVGEKITGDGNLYIKRVLLDGDASPSNLTGTIPASGIGILVFSGTANSTQSGYLRDMLYINEIGVGSDSGGQLIFIDPVGKRKLSASSGLTYNAIAGEGFKFNDNVNFNYKTINGVRDITIKGPTTTSTGALTLSSSEGFPMLRFTATCGFIYGGNYAADETAAKEEIWYGGFANRTVRIITTSARDVVSYVTVKWHQSQHDMNDIAVTNVGAPIQAKDAARKVDVENATHVDCTGRIGTANADLLAFLKLYTNPTGATLSLFSDYMETNSKSGLTANTKYAGYFSIYQTGAATLNAYLELHGVAGNTLNYRRRVANGAWDGAWVTF